MFNLMHDRIGYGGAIMVDIDDVSPPLPHRLSSTDVHDWRTDERSLSNAATGISDKTTRALHKPDVNLWWKILEEVHV